MAVVCVGRDAELTRLREHVERAGDGVGGLVLMEGPAGIGKTTMARSCLELAAASGGATHFVSAIGPDLEPPLGIWVRLAASVALGRPGSSGTLAEGDVEDLHPHARYAAVLGLLASLGPAPAVVVLDDLHAADESSLRILTQLAPALEPTGVLVIGTLRGPLAHASAAGRAAIEALSGWVQPMTVGRLDPAGVRDVTVAFAGEAAADWAAQHDERLWQLSDGNPLIVRALLQELCVAQGERPSATELARRFEQAGVVGEVLHRRLSLLPAGGREVLVAAAVAGDHADAQTLEEVLGRPVRRDLATVVEAGVVEAPPDGPVAFVHPTLAESVLAAAADLRELHLRVATTLQRRGDDSDAVVVLRHLVAAGDLVEREVLGRAALAAADQALRLGDQAAAAWALDEALAAGADADPVELLLRSAAAHHLAGHQEEAWARARRAAELAGPERPDDLARAALEFGSGRDYATDAPVAVALLRDALAVLDRGHPLRPEVLALLSVLEMSLPIPVEPGTLPSLREQEESAGAEAPAPTVAWHWITRPEIARPLADEALELARERDDEQLVGRVAMSWRQAHCDPAYLGERLALTGRAYETAAAPADRVAAAVATVLDFLEAGDRPPVDRALAEMRGLAAATGDAGWRWRNAQLESMVALASGQVERAEQLSAEAFAHGAQADENGRWVVRTAQLLMATVLTSDGEPEVLDFVVDHVDSFAYPPLRAGVALGLGVFGRTEGLEFLDELVDHVTTDPGREASWNMTLALTADAVALARRTDLAERLVPVLEPLTDHIAIDGLGLYCHGCLARPLAAILVVLGRAEEAARAIALATEKDTAAGLGYFVVADRLVELAVETIRPDPVPSDWLDRVRAVRAEADHRGFGRLAVAAQRLADRVAAPLLTDRQHEVLRSLARGDTYQQIGNELGFSHSTIRHEAMRIYAALGANDRTEAVRIGRRRGLLDPE